MHAKTIFWDWIHDIWNAWQDHQLGSLSLREREKKNRWRYLSLRGCLLWYPFAINLSPVFKETIQSVWSVFCQRDASKPSRRFRLNHWLSEFNCFSNLLCDKVIEILTAEYLPAFYDQLPSLSCSGMILNGYFSNVRNRKGSSIANQSFLLSLNRFTFQRTKERRANHRFGTHCDKGQIFKKHAWALG